MSEYPWRMKCEHPDNSLVPEGEGWIHCAECRTCIALNAVETLAPEMAEAILAWEGTPFGLHTRLQLLSGIPANRIYVELLDLADKLRHSTKEQHDD